ncbi:Hemin transport protein HemS [Tepidimonas alkaliphilus]|uniref:Hemin transport protein HemS n=1 Tax=Tepidimonas alkaliphilus TaxID=2588942 RepID=A0A554W9Z0_9BURK|nr:ChuX/HutX family heme-like substrate-binding protein [Tepidimonas alkaliphilus]TSE20397.1 Hemin transport protein HemS [Tepidimonas alkaliphilus]
MTSETPLEQAQRLREAVAQGLQRGLRLREAAQAAGCSEGEALAAHQPAAWPGGCPPHDAALVAYPLRCEGLALLQSLQSCGPLMALTRNDAAVHEKVGVYQNVSGEGAVGLALGPDIDLRLFWSHWHAGFAVADRPGQGVRSLQFFDAFGQAVHKIHRREETDAAAWEAVVERFRATQAWPGFRRGSAQPDAAAATNPSSAPAFLQAWDAMTDTHEFAGLLRRFGVTRWQAMQWAEGRHTYGVARDSLQRLLEAAAFEGAPIMVFVGNPGCIQIHTGPVRRIHTGIYGGQTWVNVLDERFNLHVRQDDVHACWVVRKPTRDGVVSSLEVFDRHGEVIAMLFGARKPGEPERPVWRALLASLPEATPQEVAG